MFERYTEKARRVIFFARYEASALSSPVIGTEHLLLGLLREGHALVANHLKVDGIKLAERLRSIAPGGQSVSTSVDLPLSDAGKRVLAYAAEEAMRMAHTHIGTEHLLLGVLREETGPAAEVLRALGAPAVAEVRTAITESAPNESLVWSPPRVNLVDETTGQQLPGNLSLSALPRMGEAVLLPGADEATVRYRVVDVHYDLQPRAKGAEPVLHAVWVRLRRES